MINNLVLYVCSRNAIVFYSVVINFIEIVSEVGNKKMNYAQCVGNKLKFWDKNYESLILSYSFI